MKNKVIDKIRKLMSLASDEAASIGEVENAMIMAKRLMIKHEIEESSINEININDISQEFVNAVDKKYYEYEDFQWELIDAIANGYNCKITKKNKTFRIIGTKENREAVLYLYSECLVKFRSLSVKSYLAYKQEIIDQVKMKFKQSGLSTTGVGIKMLENRNMLESKNKYISSYLSGAIEGLSRKLKRESNVGLSYDEERSYGLIVHNNKALLEIYIKENVEGLKMVDNIAYGGGLLGQAYHQGIIDGDSNHGIRMIE